MKRLTATLILLLGSSLAAQALLSTNYGDFAANTLTYKQVKEATVYGGYGAPVIVGDQITFNPFDMAASSANHASPAPQSNDAELQFDVVANAGQWIDEIKFDEAGDWSMSGFVANSAYVQVTAHFHLTIQEIDHGAFNMNQAIYTNLTFTTGLIGHTPIFSSDDWTGGVSFDLDAILADKFVSGYTNGVTKAHLTLDNILFAIDDGINGADAIIKKKAAGGLTITSEVIPEPASAVLFIGAASGLAFVRRRFIG